MVEEGQVGVEGVEDLEEGEVEGDGAEEVQEGEDPQGIKKNYCLSFSSSFFLLLFGLVHML